MRGFVGTQFDARAQALDNALVNEPQTTSGHEPERQPGFVWSGAREPHAQRRREMLQKYPQIKALYGPCARTKYVCAALVMLQLGVAYLVRGAPFWAIVGIAYLFGGVLNQALLLAIHELSHNLGFRKPWQNRAFALFINLPVGVPVAETFRYYHLLHHVHQGEDGTDTDLPTELEGRILKSSLTKLIWVMGQGFAYALRPLFVHPKRPTSGELFNLALQLAFDGLVLHFWGLKALAYLPISSLIVMGLHPVAGHYISEHYLFRQGQETYSYYGPLNRLTFNVGYHNEHHDFPYIPGSRIARLRQIAPEYYDTLLSHTSWTRVIWDYVTRPELGGFSRVKRRASERARADGDPSPLP